MVCSWEYFVDAVAMKMLSQAMNYLTLGLDVGISRGNLVGSFWIGGLPTASVSAFLFMAVKDVSILLKLVL